MTFTDELDEAPLVDEAPQWDAANQAHSDDQTQPDGINQWAWGAHQTRLSDAALSVRENFAQQSPNVMPGAIDPETWRTGVRNPWADDNPWARWTARWLWDPRNFPPPPWPARPSGPSSWPPRYVDEPLQNAADFLEQIERGVRRVKRSVDRWAFFDTPVPLPIDRGKDGRLYATIDGVRFEIPNFVLWMLAQMSAGGSAPAFPAPAAFVPGDPPPSAMPPTSAASHPAAAAPSAVPPSPAPPAAPAPTQPLPAGLT